MGWQARLNQKRRAERAQSLLRTTALATVLVASGIVIGSAVIMLWDASVRGQRPSTLRSDADRSIAVELSENADLSGATDVFPPGITYLPRPNGRWLVEASVSAVSDGREGRIAGDFRIVTSQDIHDLSLSPSVETELFSSEGDVVSYRTRPKDSVGQLEDRVQIRPIGDDFQVIEMPLPSTPNLAIGDYATWTSALQFEITSPIYERTGLGSGIFRLVTEPAVGAYLDSEPAAWGGHTVFNGPDEMEHAVAPVLIHIETTHGIEVDSLVPEPDEVTPSGAFWVIEGGESLIVEGRIVAGWRNLLSDAAPVMLSVFLPVLLGAVVAMWLASGSRPTSSQLGKNSPASGSDDPDWRQPGGYL